MPNCPSKTCKRSTDRTSSTQTSTTAASSISTAIRQPPIIPKTLPIVSVAPALPALSIKHKDTTTTLSTPIQMDTAAQPQTIPAALPIMFTPERYISFIADHPKVWFDAMDAILFDSDEHAKYRIILSLLPSRYIVLCSDIISQHGYETGRLNQIKEKIITDAKVPALRHFYELNRIEQGNRSPSELYSLMKLKATGFGIDQKILIFEFLSKLPKEIRWSLIPFIDADVNHLLNLADTMWTMPSNRREERVPSISVATQVSPPTSAGNVPDLSLRRYNEQPVQRRQQPSPSPANRTSASDDINYRRSTYRKGNPLCYFHHVSGDQARKCRPPCAWNAR